jgi:hypothetical protein
VRELEHDEFEDDINNGYLRVRIGLAAVRPAEFIVLEFSHKVNE